jgi:hypothetical protein
MAQNPGRLRFAGVLAPNSPWRAAVVPGDAPLVQSSVLPPATVSTARPLRMPVTRDSDAPSRRGGRCIAYAGERASSFRAAAPQRRRRAHLIEALDQGAEHAAIGSPAQNVGSTLSASKPWPSPRPPLRHGGARGIERGTR